MKPNKSIDGLKTRSKKNAPKKPSTKAPAKEIDGTVKKPKKTSIPKKTVVIPVGEVEDSEVILASETHEKAAESFLEPVRSFDYTAGKLEETPEDTEKAEEIEEDKVVDKKLVKNLKKEQKKEAKLAKKFEKAKKPRSKVRTVIAIIALVIVLALIGGILFLMFWGNDIISKITGGRDNIFTGIGALFSQEREPLKTDANGRTNIMVFGTSGYDMEGSVDDGNWHHDGSQLTDSLMVISVNQDNGDIAMLNLPRDLKASRTCTATGKINEIFWCNNMNNDAEEQGAQALINEVSNILGIEFQYYVHLNWGSLVSVVDALGGIKVTLDEDIHDYIWTEAVYDAGVEYTLNGQQALDLARARHGTTLGDFSRGNSQQKILIGIKNRIYEQNVSLDTMMGMANTLGDNLRTNFTMAELKSAALLTFEFDMDSMRQVSLLDWSKGIHYMTTATINGISYVVPSAGVGNYTAIRSYVKEQFESNPIIREKGQVMILNGTETVGLAGEEKTKLEEQSYLVSKVDNAPAGSYPDKYAVYVLSEDVPETKKALEKLYGVTAKTELPAGIDGSGYDIVIILGGETPAEEPTEEE